MKVIKMIGNICEIRYTKMDVLGFATLVRLYSFRKLYCFPNS